MRESTERSSFPYKIINGIAEKFTEAYVSVLEVPVEFMYISFLTCLGSMLAHRITLHTEIKPQPRLYTLLLGESADTRKSTAITKTTEFFRFASKNIGDWQFTECWGTGSAEGLARILKSKDPSGKKTLLLCYDEFKGFVSKAKIKSSTLLECVSSLFESNRYENNVKHTGLLIEDGCLSLIAASTVQTYEVTWDKSFTDIGFSNRLFIVPGNTNRKYVLPPQIPLSIKRTLTQELFSILDFVGPFREINISDSALSILQTWYTNRPASVHSKRLEGYALRFLILMAANQRQDTIDDKMVTDVISLMNWQFEMRQMYDPIDADNAIAAMEEKIRRLLKNRRIAMTERELKQSTNANRGGIWLFAKAITNLRDSDEIIYNKNTKQWNIKGLN